MKKAKMKISISGTEFSYYPGQEVILTDEIAEAWNEIGHCEVIGDYVGEKNETTADAMKVEETPTDSQEEVEASEVKTVKSKHKTKGGAENADNNSGN